MTKEIFIKGHAFGTGRPIICVPIVERTKEDILKAARLMTEHQVEMIEWRMDWYEYAGDIHKVQEVLQELSPLMEKTVLLCTFRSKAQGGSDTLTEESYMELNYAVAHTGIPDLVDLEFFEVQHPEQMIERLHHTGVFVVGSNHNFAMTPKTEELIRQLEEIQAAKADFAKVAVMPKKKSDVLHLMEAVVRRKEAYPDGHLIAMSMGDDGIISRLLGQWYHSEVTFASFGKPSAPGQIPWENVKEILQKLEEWTK